MTDKLKKIVDNIPFNPGIYLMKDKEDKIIYVGKAISLRKRVRQYFQKTNKTQRILNMVSNIDHIDYIVCRNEVEALVLECNYIKENSPKFNVLLKDDKTYPYIKITVKDPFPGIYMTRTIKSDGAKYYGPYADVKAVKESLEIIKQIFPIKRCKYSLKKITKNSNFPCLYYHIGRCIGPCINNIGEEEYSKIIKQVCMFLEGKHADVKALIVEEIDKCIKKLDFERAQKLKERLESIDKLNEKQTVSNLNEAASDIVGYYLEESTLHIQIFKNRNARIVSHEVFKLENVEESEISLSIYELLMQYYSEKEIVPKIYVKLDLEDRDNSIESLSEYLTNILGKKVEVKVPQKGEKHKLIEMVENNIKINLIKAEDKNNQMKNLSEFLKLDYEINSLEAYDISNLRNEYIVGALVRYEDGKLNKSKYRKFKIKSTLMQNDPLCMYEVLSRRFKHAEDWQLPDILLIDGGKTQVNAVNKAVSENDIDINVYGMIKNDKHKTRGLIDSLGNEYIFEDTKKDKSILNFISFIQEEIHRFVIRYHRSLRDKI
ncbi:MAG: excinuclease ABC subunit UvrC [Clostridia bacterium]